VPEPASPRSYEFHPEAEGEFLAELDRLGATDPIVAGDFITEVYEGVHLLLEHPEAGPALGRSRLLRRKVLRRFRFTLIYAVEPHQIRVLAVAHDNRRPGYWRARLEK
jgi:plasmid stabilization system protein ParE